MQRNARITSELAREFFSYDARKGALIWKKSCGNRCRIGKLVGNLSGGYRETRIFGKRYKVHRLVWLFVKGKWPSMDLDHINGIRDDNRIENLREATPEINAQNQRFPKRNTLTGVLGVTKDKHGFIAQIGVKDRNIFLGRFPTTKLAHIAYVEAKRKLHPGGTL